MVRMLGTILTLGGVLLAAPIANAFSMGEVAATTGVHGTLAGTGSTGAAGTIGTVKKSLGASVGTKQAQLTGAAPGIQVGWGGKGGGRSGWTTASAGWGGTAARGGWTAASSSWATAASGASAWIAGGWK